MDNDEEGIYHLCIASSQDFVVPITDHSSPSHHWNFSVSFTMIVDILPPRDCESRQYMMSVHWGLGSGWYMAVYIGERLVDVLVDNCACWTAMDMNLYNAPC